MTEPGTNDYRAVFDFDVSFLNGGGIQGQGFRLDIEGDEIDDAELATHVVRELRLLMVGEVGIVNKRVIREDTRGPRCQRRRWAQRRATACSSI